MQSNSSSNSSPAGEKLQKVLSRAGLGSRRACEELIAHGQIKVNGKIAQLGVRVTEADKIKYKDQLLKDSRVQKQPTRVILYNKPEGLVCSRKDEQGRDTIYSQLPKIFQGRWISIGRLDLNTSGLLVLTNNGDLANRMMHPSYEMEREYTVRVFGEVTDEMLQAMKKGVQLEDGPAKFNRIIPLPTEDGVMNRWFKVIIKEGRKREVRRIWESQGVQVSRLHRIRYGELSMPRNLRTGKTEELTWKQVNQLLRSVDLPEESQPDKRPTKRFDKTGLSKRNASKSDRTLAGKFGRNKPQRKTRIGSADRSNRNK
ncbi:23S rRNA pseudouridine(2605) synthase RluB [Thiomicrorhabdus indica]|uniref:23S rRNA pseudouridine(2605) synthase RluB n=1 Tax=Thiomicrorhabdus indica TaxID=2267253 RepID=UPI00102E06CE|nr:pseudouridine synthase [Thiomicrorhabdus indica]